jgi:thioredoxin reductase
VTIVGETHDLVIIGAGEAGQAAAHLARRKGASVAIIYRELFGGSCPFWACMPVEGAPPRRRDPRHGRRLPLAAGVRLP